MAVTRETERQKAVEALGLVNLALDKLGGAANWELNNIPQPVSIELKLKAVRAMLEHRIESLEVNES